MSEARAGATSLLNQAEQTLRSAPRLVCSRVDLGVQDSAYDARAFWADALAPLRAGTAGPRIQALTDAALSSPTPEALAGIAAELELRRTRLVLFLDDFDAILYLPNIREHRLLAVLRSLAQRDPPPICLVFSTRTDLESLGRALERHSPTGSPYLNYISERRLGALSAAELHDLLALGQEQISMDDRRFVALASGHHPYLANALADALWHTPLRPRARRERQVTAGLEALDAARSTLGQIWRRRTELERRLILTRALRLDEGALGGGVDRSPHLHEVERWVREATTSDQLRRVVRGHLGAAAADLLPSSPASHAELAHAIVALAARLGRTSELLGALAAEVPGRAAELATIHGQTPSDPPDLRALHQSGLLGADGQGVPLLTAWLAETLRALPPAALRAWAEREGPGMLTPDAATTLHAAIQHRGWSQGARAVIEGVARR